MSTPGSILFYPPSFHFGNIGSLIYPTPDSQFYALGSADSVAFGIFSGHLASLGYVTIYPNQTIFGTVDCIDIFHRAFLISAFRYTINSPCPNDSQALKYIKTKKVRG